MSACSSAGAHSPEEDRHAEGGHLVVGHRPLGVAGHQLGDGLRRNRVAVALAVDDLVRAHATRLAHAPGSGNSTASEDDAVWSGRGEDPRLLRERDRLRRGRAVALRGRPPGRGLGGPDAARRQPGRRRRPDCGRHRRAPGHRPAPRPGLRRARARHRRRAAGGPRRAGHASAGRTVHSGSTLWRSSRPDSPRPSPPAAGSSSSTTTRSWPASWSGSCPARGSRCSTRRTRRWPPRMLARRETRPDLILLDVKMPRIDGPQFCRFVKRNERFRGIKVILCTGAARDTVEQLAAECGADGFLFKDEFLGKWVAEHAGSSLSTGRSRDGAAGHGRVAVAGAGRPGSGAARRRSSPVASSPPGWIRSVERPVQRTDGRRPAEARRRPSRRATRAPPPGAGRRRAPRRATWTRSGTGGRRRGAGSARPSCPRRRARDPRRRAAPALASRVHRLTAPLALRLASFQPVRSASPLPRLASSTYSPPACGRGGVGEHLGDDHAGRRGPGGGERPGPGHGRRCRPGPRPAGAPSPASRGTARSTDATAGQREAAPHGSHPGRRRTRPRPPGSRARRGARRRPRRAAPTATSTPRRTGSVASAATDRVVSPGRMRTRGRVDRRGPVVAAGGDRRWPAAGGGRFPAASRTSSSTGASVPRRERPRQGQREDVRRERPGRPGEPTSPRGNR